MELSFIVAIDFTASNGDPALVERLWLSDRMLIIFQLGNKVLENLLDKKRIFSQPSSLHYNDPSGRPNEYLTAIRAVGDIIQVIQYTHTHKCCNLSLIRIMTLINSSRLWVLVHGYLHRERFSTRTVIITITTTINVTPPKRHEKALLVKVISLSQVSHNFNLSLSSSSPYCKVSSKHISFVILFALFSILYFLSKVLFPPHLHPNIFMSAWLFWGNFVQISRILFAKR